MQHGVITDGAEPGRFHPYPYQLGMLDAMSDPDITDVTIKKSKRVGFTQIMTLAAGYFIQQDPSQLLIVQPTIDDAKEYSKDTFAPMLEDMPVMRGLVSEVKSRDSSNTIQHKRYPGGEIHLRGANSMRGFRRLTKRVAIGDEVDAWPVIAGGDQVKAMQGRTDTYGHRRKHILGSTPLYEESSRIQRAYKLSDQRLFLVPCPRCKGLQPITWDRMKWPENNPERCYMQCSECGNEISHVEKFDMLDAALQHGDQGWHVTNADAKGHAGFWIWAGYSMSPSAAWGQLATEFLEAKQTPEMLMTFTNEVLAQTFELEGEKIDADHIYMKRRSQIDALPQKACVLTAGVDVQKNRFEVEVVAWAPDLESWSADYAVLYGDPSSKELQQQLDAYLARTYAHESGKELAVSAVAIDTGSNLYTETIYAYCKARLARRFYAIKGRGGAGLPVLVNQSSNNKHKVMLFTLGVDAIKAMFYQRLAIEQPGAGYCHFPIERDQQYFYGLTSERIVKKYSMGQEKPAFIHDRSIPNEPLDCRVYATAALHILNPSWKAFQAVVATGEESEPEPKKNPLAMRTVRRPRPRGNWVTRY